MTYEERFYREYSIAPELVKYEIKEKESDLLIFTDTDLSSLALESLFKHRKEIEAYIESDPAFQSALKPHKVNYKAPPIIKAMAEYSKKANVGPMAAVAGAIAEFVGKDLAKHSANVIIENGGDIYLKTASLRKIGVFAGASPLSEKIAIIIDPKDSPLGICTSAGTVGPSKSFGKADAVAVLARSTLLADAAATAIGNVVLSKETIENGLKLAEKIKDILGVLIIKDDQMGVRGKIEIEAI